jgi:Histidine kinase
VNNRNLSYWLCQIFGWGTWTVISILATTLSQGGVHFFPAGWLVRLLVNYAIFFVCAILFTHLLRAQIRKRQWLNLPMRKAAPRLLAASVLVGVCSSAQVLAVDAVTLRGLTGLPAKLYLTSNMIFVCIVWTVFYAVNIRARRTREMEANLREAQLRALEGQVNPHFLFNSLNTIRGMIVEDPRIAQDMVTRLANILRYSLQRDRTYTVPLEREIEVVADYLAIESIRFDDRLQVRMEIDPAAAGAEVPSMLVQTLVENAVKHGIGTRTEGGEIVIRALIRNGALAMEIVNSGQLSAPAEGATQIGLANARERLRLLYGERATLRLENRDASTVAAMVSIPA